MEDRIKHSEHRTNDPRILIPVVGGFIINLLGTMAAGRLGLPIFLDSIGTLVSTALGGIIPGILTALLTNIINFTMDGISIYYAALNALIAVASYRFFSKKLYRSAAGIIRFILLLAFIGGCLGSIITWCLSGPGSGALYDGVIAAIAPVLGMHPFVSHIIANFVIDIIDKAITVVIAILVYRLVPAGARRRMTLTGWHQTPLSDEEVEREDHMAQNTRSLSVNIAIILVFASLSMAVVVTWISTNLFADYSRRQHIKITEGTATIAASVIDADRVDDFLKLGEAAPGYKETEQELYNIRSSSADIKYVYVYKIEEDGCHVVFDLDTEDLAGAEPGEVIEFDESFGPYIDNLLAGREIETIITDDTYGWLMTAYEPVYDSNGRCVCYACADVAMGDIIGYEHDFLTKVITLFLGFFILILVVGLWIAKYNVILPVNAMAACASEFAFTEKGNDFNEDILKRIHGLDIDTGDEIENLYHAFCRMTDDIVAHVKDIQEQSEKINKLQNGLILIMADMVEGRDSDTGYHTRKTAAYTRIIMDGLKRLGYYEDQLTEKFMDDVEQSAPLHDLGKICVSDVILNKPGKLTDDEFEIMKTHTTEGMKIMEQAISKVQGESYLTEARNLSAFHHEKWNGKGYPTGLKGEEIPLSARIMAIADVFDALTSKRVYKDAMPFEKAVDIIQKDSGSHFDPKCVEAFMDSLGEVKKVLDRYNALEAEDEAKAQALEGGAEVSAPKDGAEASEAKAET